VLVSGGRALAKLVDLVAVGQLVGLPPAHRIFGVLARRMQRRSRYLAGSPPRLALPEG
jgi:hypothetical protein